MIAEEQQDDLSMEDILSSIKDILDKDSTEQTENVQVSGSEAAASQKVEVVEEIEAEDDVYDLSAAMIIDDPLPEEDSSEDDIVDLKLDEVDISIPEIADEPIDIVDENISLPDDTVDIDFEIDAEPIFSPEDNVSGNEEAEEDIDVGALLETNIESEIEEAETVVETDIENVVEGIDDILTSASKMIDADSKTEEKVENEPVSETDSADVSANIISNFAKMFAEKAPVEPIAEVKEEKEIAAAPIKLLGNATRTIEQVVEDVIKNIIGESVSAELVKNVDINTFAEQEIKVQTKAWLDAKLPSIVEAAVQKEIERVMAKVGR